VRILFNELLKFVFCSCHLYCYPSIYLCIYFNMNKVQNEREVDEIFLSRNEGGAAR
jgi:hypothetical protein